MLTGRATVVIMLRMMKGAPGGLAVISANALAPKAPSGKPPSAFLHAEREDCHFKRALISQRKREHVCPR
jgi:hypothetical protein